MSTDSSSKRVSQKPKPKAQAKSQVLWNPWLAVLVGIFALFGSQIMAGVVLSFYPLIKGWSSVKANNWVDSTIGIEFLLVLLAEALAIAIIYLYLNRYKYGLRAIGLRKPKWEDPLYGLIGLPAYLAIFLIAQAIIKHLVPGLNLNEKQQLGFNNPQGFMDLVLTFISLVVLPPIAEEIIFRGLIYTSLKKVMPIVWAVLTTSVLFAAGHLREGGSAGPLYIAAIDTFSLSLVLIYLREKTDGLWASMTLHCLKNLIAFLALFVLHWS